MPDEPRRRWQFSIRDVLLVMLSVGLAAGWFADRRRMADELQRQQNRMYVIWPDNVDPVSNSYFSDRQAIWSDLQGLTGTTPGFPYVVQADGAIINWPPESPTP